MYDVISCSMRCVVIISWVYIIRVYVHVQSMSYNSESVTVRSLFSRSLRARDTTATLQCKFNSVKMHTPAKKDK